MKIIDTSKIHDWPGEVILGYSEIDENRDNGILLPHELTEYDSFTNENRKAEYLASRYLFRFMIKTISLDPEEVRIKKEEKGKPFALNEGKRVHVSFSHSKSMVMCAVSEEKDIGLDIESTDRVIDRKIVKRILNENEWEVVGEEDPIKLWTIKEAAVKCLGTGLRTNLKDLTILRTGENRFSIRFNDENSFEICSFRQLNHQIALAY